MDQDRAALYPESPSDLVTIWDRGETLEIHTRRNDRSAWKLHSGSQVIGQAGALMREVDKRVRIRQKTSFGGSGELGHEAVLPPQPGFDSFVYPETPHVEDPGGCRSFRDCASHEPRDVAPGVNEAYWGLPVARQPGPDARKNVIARRRQGPATMVPQRRPLHTNVPQALVQITDPTGVLEALELLEADLAHAKPERGQTSHIWNHLGLAEGIERPVIGEVEYGHSK